MYIYALLNVSKEDYNYANLSLHINLLHYEKERRCYQYHLALIFLHKQNYLTILTSNRKHLTIKIILMFLMYLLFILPALHKLF